MKSFLTIANVLISFYSYSFVDAESSGHLKVGAIGHSGPSKIFPFKKYEEFQISDGIAGTSLEKARKVFVEPFSGINLEEITQNDLNNLVTMMRFAVESENPFNDALKKAGSTKRRPNVPLTAGKVANKILKLVGAIQVIEVSSIPHMGHTLTPKSNSYHVFFCISILPVNDRQLHQKLNTLQKLPISPKVKMVRPLG
ncbi:hypothetical protein MJO28_006568 [Puccinia striiformis f. sp. tritici]|uniref:Uncharacterized protein n=1 Tax=Puccinia striiformis f. sp. tritici TaxID=168172 RepID=A0ACC0EJD1_9BASI|nr:hypothetical protein MJO28_006568 [Puccinia striiformis f. sp. tritici]